MLEELKKKRLNMCKKRVLSVLLALTFMLPLLPMQFLAAALEDETAILTTYTITFRNFDDTETLGTMALEEGAALTTEAISAQIAAPERADHTFMGWSLAQGDIAETDTAADRFTVTADTTLFAVYSRNKVDLIYMTGSNEDDPGEEIARFRRDSNDRTNQIRLANTIQTVADWESYVTRDGFRFLGWKCGELGKPLNNSFMTNTVWTGAVDRYMYAQYEQTAEMHQVSLKNFDGSELLATISVASDTPLTAAQIEEMVSQADALRNAYVFMGWSDAMGDVDNGFAAPEEFAITADTDLYAVYRPIQPGDIDEQLLVDLSDAVDGLESAVTSVGLTMDTITKTPDREDQFYTYLNEYMESRFPEEMAQARAASESADATYANTRAASDNGTRKSHALKDANWMVSQRPELNYAQEVLYQYTSHFVDVVEPFSGTGVSCDEISYHKYVTDLDRRTYKLFYSKGRAISIYENLMTLATTAAGGGELAGGFVQALDKHTKLTIRLYHIANTVWNGINVATAVPGLMNNYYSRIMATPCDDKESFFTSLDGLIDDIEDDLRPNFNTMSAKYAIGTFLAVGGVALGGSLFVASAALIGTANSAFTALLDRVNFLSMRMYIQTRISERMMYAWGWTDGRN